MLIKGVRQVIFYLCRYVTAPDKRHLRSAEAGKRGLCVHQIESTCRIVFLRQEITEISDVFDKFFYCCPEVTVSVIHLPGTFLCCPAAQYAAAGRKPQV
jgi:hypothetical protein